MKMFSSLITITSIFLSLTHVTISSPNGSPVCDVPHALQLMNSSEMAPNINQSHYSLSISNTTSTSLTLKIGGTEKFHGLLLYGILNDDSKLKVGEFVGFQGSGISVFKNNYAVCGNQAQFPNSVITHTESQVYDPTQINFTYNLPKATSKTQYKLTFLGIIVNRLSSGYSWEKVEVSQTWKINLIPDVGGNGTSIQPVAGSNKNVGNTNNRGMRNGSPLFGLIVGILTLFLY